MSSILSLCGPVLHYIASICCRPKQLQQFLPFTNLSLSSFLLPSPKKRSCTQLYTGLWSLPSKIIKSIPIELVTYCLIYSICSNNKKLNCASISTLKNSLYLPVFYRWSRAVQPRRRTTRRGGTCLRRSRGSSVGLSCSSRRRAPWSPPRPRNSSVLVWRLLLSPSSSMVLNHQTQYSILCYLVLWRFLVLLSYIVQPRYVCVRSFDLLKHLTGEGFS